MPVPEGALANIDGTTVLRPAKHGLTLEWSPAPGKRVMLRVWTFGEQAIAGTDATAEFPQPLAAVDALTHLRHAMETLREWMVRDPAAASADMEAAGLGLPHVIQQLAELRTEPLTQEVSAA
jgi:hypothetical protein